MRLGRVFSLLFAARPHFSCLSPLSHVAAPSLAVLPSAIVPSSPPVRLASFCNAQPRSNSVVHIHVLATDLTAVVCASVHYPFPGWSTRDVRGCKWRDTDKSIRQCPPVTRQSGLIVRGERVESPRARLVRQRLSSEQSIALHVVVIVVVTPRRWCW